MGLLLREQSVAIYHLKFRWVLFGKPADKNEIHLKKKKKKVLRKAVSSYLISRRRSYE